MNKRQSKFCQLQEPFRSYKKLYLIATEGRKTEPEYFAILNKLLKSITIKHIPQQGSGNASAPLEVLKRMQCELENNRPEDSSWEAWLVTDRDCWLVTDLDALQTWSQDSSNHGFALTNPKFEYWLLLHFEDGTGIKSSKDIARRLKKYLLNYDKGIKPRKITIDRVQAAVRRAELRDRPPCQGWPHNQHCTTVYRLVKNMLEANDAK